MNIVAPLSWLELHRNSSLSEARLRRLQDRRFRQTIHHAFQWVPFYREAFEKQGLHPQDLRTVRDIGKLPIMSRESLQDVDPASRLDYRLQATDCIERSTGGSTGRPLLSYTGSSELTYETLGWVRTWKRLGLRLGDHQVTIKHPDDIAQARSGKWYQHLGLLRLSYLDLRDPAPKLRPAVRTPTGRPEGSALSAPIAGSRTSRSAQESVDPPTTDLLCRRAPE